MRTASSTWERVKSHEWIGAPACRLDSTSHNAFQRLLVKRFVRAKRYYIGIMQDGDFTKLLCEGKVLQQ